jgi:hypothetical protein
MKRVRISKKYLRIYEAGISPNEGADDACRDAMPLRLYFTQRMALFHHAGHSLDLFVDDMRGDEYHQIIFVDRFLGVLE